jgi:peptidoglycan hydrolase-like protein with peptidoglycan-binding domain
MAGQRGREASTRGRHRRWSPVVAAATGLSVGLLMIPVAAQADDPPEPGSSSSGGSSYGGRSTGPAPLSTLPPDPAYPVPEPPVTEVLPEEVDVVPPWQGNVVCDPVDKPGLEAFGSLVGEHYGRPGYTTSRTCIDQKSEHYDGRAVDWQLNAFDPADRRIGDAVVTWLTDNDGEMAKRFGLQSIIWNERSWHSTDTTWKGYVGQSPHTDHVHFSFTWDGAMMRTSWWTGEALETPDYGPCSIVAGAYAAVPLAARTEPCQPGLVSVPWSGYSDIRPGQSGPGLELVQPLLDVEQTGVLDPQTRVALMAWQTEQGVPQTGVLDQLTYAAALDLQLPELPEAALAVPVPEHMVTVYTEHRRARLAEGDQGPAVEILQQAIGAHVDGDFGPKTAKALKEFTEEHPLLRTAEETSALLWHLLEVRDFPTMPYRAMELEVGDEGQAVTVLQAQLGVETDGKFGPLTEAAVQAAQQQADLEATGVVDGPTWAALDQGVSGPKIVVADLRGGNVSAPGQDD